MAIKYLSGITVDSTVLVVDSANDRVGIGTASPGFRLDVVGSDSAVARIYTTNSAQTISIGSTNQTQYTDIILPTDDGQGEIFRAGSGYSSYGGVRALNIWNSNGPIAFHPNNTGNVMYLSTTGNVGIGTTSPNAKLEVYSGTSRFWHGGTTYYTEFNNSNEINTYDSNGTIATMFLNWVSGGAVNIARSAIYAQNAGNVGIGTTSPSYKLDVSGSIRSAGAMEPSTAAWIDAAFTTKVGGSAYGGGLALIDGTAGWAMYTTGNGQYLNFSSGATSGGVTARMRIQNNGALNLSAYGSGSNTGTATQRLAVDASGNIIEIPIGSGPVDGNGTANYVTKWSDTDTITNSIIYDNGTNVGIGTTSPGAKLHVNGTFRSNAFFTLSNGISYWGPNGVEYGYLTWDTGYAKIGASGTNTLYLGGGNQITILDGGNVGINTTSPAYKLDVNGGSAFRDTIRVVATPTDVAYLSWTGTNTGVLTLLHAGSATAQILASGNSYLNGGNVGIGTTAPSEKLVVSDGGAAGFEFIPSSGRWYRYNRSTSAYGGIYSEASEFTWSPYGTEAMRINGSGNVGIGTTSPQAVSASWTTLEVQGKSSGGGGIVYTANNGATVKSHFYSDGTSGFVGTQTNHIFGFTTNNNEVARFTTGGNLLIGTTTDAGYKLDVSGTARITGTVSSETSFYVVATPPANNGGLINVRDAVTATNVTSFGGIFFNSSPGSDYSIGKLTENGTGFLQVRNANNGSELLRINSSGISTFASSVTASSLIKSGGTSSQYLMADGSVSTTETINLYTQTFYVPNTGGTAQWAKLGTWTVGQGGNVVTVQIDQHAGYNATTGQNQQVYIYMKTSNGSSVDANGFAGDSSFWTEGLNQYIQSGDVIWEANAAGVAATSYTLYVNVGQYTNASQYTVTTRGGTWTNVGTLTSPSGTTSSSTILLSENRFVVNNILTVGGAPSGNVLIGTYTDVGAKLNVAGGIRTNTLSWGDSDNAPLGSLSYGASSVTLETNAAYPIQLITNGTNAIFIGTNQNVLIGTTTDNGRKLQVQGDASVSGEIYSNQISQSRYIRYVFGGTNFAVGASTGIRWVIGRVYWNQVHWGSYSGMDIEIVNNYYNGARKKYSITNGANGAYVSLRFSQSYGSAYSRIVLGSAVDTGTTSGGYTNYYQDVYLEVNEYNQVSVIGELKGPQISIDKTSIGGGEYGWATLFSSPSASNISTFTSTQATILSSEGNWGYVDSSLGINTTSPSYNLDITAGLSDGTSNYIAIFESNKGASGNAYVGIGAYRSDALAAGRNAYINVVAPSGGAASLGLQIDGGNVGIGTPTPDAKLTIGADDSATNVGYIRLRGHDVYEANIYKTATYGIYMDTDTNARPIRIDGSAFITGITGNVLIGTTTDAGYKLDVNGTTRIQGNLITTGRQYVQSTPVNIKLPWFSLSANGTAVSDAQASDGTAAVRYSSSGNDTFFYGPYQAIDAGSYVARFRIKVASNASASYIGYIDVVGTNISGEAVSLRPNMFPTGGDYYYIDVPFNSNNDSSVFETRWIGWVGGITDTYIDHVLIVPQSRTNNVYVTDGDSYTIYEAQLPRLFIANGSGNVGIGTTSPANKLTVYQGGGVRVTGIASGDWIEMSGNLPGYSDNQYPVIKSNGTIHFANNNKYSAYLEGANTYFGILDSTTTTRVFLTTSGNSYLTGGNVGIGTTAPTQRLQVAGNEVTDSKINALGTVYGAGAFLNAFSSAGGNDVGFAGFIASQLNQTNRMWTGVHSPSGANQAFIGTPDAMPIAFWTNSTEQMRITSGGNVGIGTTSPASPLQISAASVLSQGVLSVVNTYASGGVYYPAARFVNQRGDHSYGIVSEFYTGATSGSDRPSILFNTGNSSNSWQVGMVTSGWGGNDSFGIGYRANNDPASFNAWPTARFLITTDGNVGIGTTDFSDFSFGSSILKIAGSRATLGLTSTGSLATIALISNSDSSKGIHLNQGSDGSFRWYQYSVGSETFSLAANGNLGIGTTSPSEKLHISGNVVVDYNSSYQGINSIGNKAILARVSPTTGIINYAEYATAANLNGFVMGSDDARVKGNIATDSLEFITNGSTQAFIDSSGNVGVGTTSPTQKLDVAGIIRGTSSNPYVIRAKTSSGSNSFISFEDPVNASNDQVYCGSEGNNFIIGTNYAEKLRVNSSGNVGIGTTSISYRVDISGDARILSGSLGVGVAPNATDGRIDASNDIVAYSTSDQRLKENVTPIENALEKVKTLTGVEFDWKEETAHVHGYHGHDVGIIAQDVQAVLPEAVRTNESGYLSVRYEKMIALLIEANKELAARVEELEKKLK